jgi:hypothetical protein
MPNEDEEILGLPLYMAMSAKVIAPKPERIVTIQKGDTSSFPYKAASPKITAATLIAIKPSA